MKALLALLALALPHAALAEDLTVQIDGLRNGKGNIVVCLWAAAAAFPDCESGKAVARQSIAATATAPIVFKDIPAGTIAISAFHDENGNDRFDTNFVRMPLEGVGLSNNPKMGFGPPRFKAAAFVPKAGVTLRIKMSYL